MFPQTDKSWHDYRALNQNWSYQPTLAGCAITKLIYIDAIILEGYTPVLKPNKNMIIVANIILTLFFSQYDSF